MGMMMGILTAWGCGNDDTQKSPEPITAVHPTPPVAGSRAGQTHETSSAASNGDLFVESAEQAGLEFTHFNGMQGRYYFPEIMGSGVGVLDYDNDGDLDVYVVQGNYLGPDYYQGTTPLQSTGSSRNSDRLFRNDLTKKDDGTAELHFTDVTEEAGIWSTGFGMGVAVGDFDNNGYPDIYVTNYGPNTWWLNQGDGTFADYDAHAGVEDPGLWSSSAAFLDFDRDGWLDLFVCEYVHFTFDNQIECANSSNAVDYCGPEVYAYESDRLLRNRGDGTFEDVSATSGIARKAGAGLGVVAADFNGDDWVDIFVANDGMANFLWINQKDCAFSEQALPAGCAFNLYGMQEAGMGVDAADFDGDGDEDLFMTHLLGEKNTLYINDRQGLFTDRSQGAGLDHPSRPYTGFGTGWFDFDLDGDLDLYVVNGAVKAVEPLVDQGDPFPYAMPDHLFENIDGNYRPVNGESAFRTPAISRGSIDADIDNDGDADLLINDLNGPLRLLLNQSSGPRSWIGFRVVHHRSGSNWLGARVALVQNDRPVAWRRVRSDGSYCSARDPRIVFGLKSLNFDSVWITLPNGTRHPLQSKALLNQYNTIHL
jgi:hypothetical protein